MKPSVEVSWEEKRGRMIFSDDFGTGGGQDDIPGWFEQEHYALQGKCVVRDGSPLGGRLARIYGKNLATMKHYFAKQLDLSGYKSGVLTFSVRGSNNWGYFDQAYLEFFYDGSWHPMHTFDRNDWANTGPAPVDDDDDAKPSMSAFQMIEIPLTEEMMSVEFWLRFRNGMNQSNEILDIDNVEVLAS
jgi:hypothetical protein